MTLTKFKRLEKLLIQLQDTEEYSYSWEMGKSVNMVLDHIKKQQENYR